MYIHVDMVEQQQPVLLHVRVDSIQETCLKTQSYLPGNVRRRKCTISQSVIAIPLCQEERETERERHTHTLYM